MLSKDVFFGRPIVSIPYEAVLTTRSCNDDSFVRNLQSYWTRARLDKDLEHILEQAAVLMYLRKHEVKK